MKGENLVANEPNARILISALQHIGYDDISAIADVIDNSIDANATEIKIFIDKDENNKIKITIVDNGQGMDMATLDEALKLGSNTIHEDIADLGKFGMGLSTAGLALANKTIVLTKNAESSKILKSKTDVNIIKEKNNKNLFVNYDGDGVFIKPNIKITINYLEKTKSNMLRHPFI